METVTIPKEEYDEMKEAVFMIKMSPLYKRLLEFEQRILEGKKHTRSDLGF